MSVILTLLSKFETPVQRECRCCVEVVRCCGVGVLWWCRGWVTLTHRHQPAARPGCCTVSSSTRPARHRGYSYTAARQLTPLHTVHRQPDNFGTSRLIINLPVSCLQAPLHESHPGVHGDSDSSALGPSCDCTCDCSRTKQN